MSLSESVPKLEETEITPEMIEAGLTAYDVWEPDHIFAEQGGAADYAKRELLGSIFRAMGPAQRRNEQEVAKD